ncbi:MAG TPA: hypothetical protein VF874_15070 [Mycobacterium sp.]
MWDDGYWQVYQQVQRPGGTEWTGAGADAALARVSGDRIQVVGGVDELYAGSLAARNGAWQLNTARQLVLDAVNEAQVAGFHVGEDYSVTSREPVPPTKQTAVQAQAQTFVAKIRGQVLALMCADHVVAAQISTATADLNGLTFDSPRSRATERTPAIQAAGFDRRLVPQKPPKPVPEPPPGSWSPDPLMRAAQKIAYGHASDPITGHMDDFPEMTKDQLADLTYQKMQRAINDPRGLRLGASNSDGAPVIYDPQDNVLIVRDTRPNAPDGGTVFKPDPVRDPDFVDDKFGWHESIFAPGQLADGPIAAPPSPPLPATNQGNTGVPGGPIGGSINTAPPRAAPAPAAGGSGGGGSWGDPSPTPRAIPGWGTYVPPDQAAQSDGPIGILGKILQQFLPPDPNDPNNTA